MPHRGGGDRTERPIEYKHSRLLVPRRLPKLRDERAEAFRACDCATSPLGSFAPGDRCDGVKQEGGKERGETKAFHGMTHRVFRGE